MLEGEIYPDESREEGPFGEFMGYYASNATELPIVRIRRVYWRTNPILTLAVPSRPPQNFTFARAAVKSAMIWNEVEKAGLPGEVLRPRSDPVPGLPSGARPRA